MARSKALSGDSELLFEYGIHVPSRKILIAGEVTEDTYTQLSKGLTLLGQDKPIEIELNSGGGDVFSGFAIYDLLKSFQSDVTIKVMGHAMSMSSIILQAGDHRLLGKHASLMIHDGEESHEGTPDNILAWAKYAAVQCQQMYRIYAQASGRTEKFWKERCKGDFIMTAEEAVKLGLADAIIE